MSCLNQVPPRAHTHTRATLCLLPLHCRHTAPTLPLGTRVAGDLGLLLPIEPEKGRCVCVRACVYVCASGEKGRVGVERRKEQTGGGQGETEVEGQRER